MGTLCGKDSSISEWQLKKLIELKSSARKNTYLGRHILEDASLKIWQREVIEMQKNQRKGPLAILSREHIYFAAGAVDCDLRGGWDG